jgi:metal-responsive CopG/Arc/MetJ family transcriptional regulator
MTEPFVAITTREIIKLAFSEFIKSSAGEAAKEMTREALSKAGDLRQRIISWFKDKRNTRAESAILEIQQQGSLESFHKLVMYLDEDMKKEPSLAQELQHLAQQVNNLSIVSQGSSQSSEANKFINAHGNRNVFQGNTINGNNNNIVESIDNSKKVINNKRIINNKKTRLSLSIFAVAGFALGGSWIAMKASWFQTLTQNFTSSP